MFSNAPKTSKAGTPSRAAANPTSQKKEARADQPVTDSVPQVQFAFSHGTLNGSSGGSLGISSDARVIHPKLKIGKPNDRFEQEADAMADRVTYDEVPQIRAKCTNCEKDKLQRQEEVQEETENELQANWEQEYIQPKNHSNHIINRKDEEDESLPDEPSDPSSEIRLKDVSGKDPPVTDISQMARMIHAQAFATGRDIYFAAGKYQPHTTAGKWLLAHELTHTIQQGAVNQSAIAQTKQSNPTRAGPDIQKQDESDLSGSESGESSLSEEEQEVFDSLVDEASGGGSTSGEESIGVECPDMVEAVAQWAMGEEEREGQQERVEEDVLISDIIEFLPESVRTPLEFLGNGPLWMWNQLPESVQSAAIDRFIDRTIEVVDMLPNIHPSDRYSKVVLKSFLRKIKEEDASVKVGMLRKFSSIIFGGNLSFMWGLLKGLLVGFFADGILGLIQMVIDLVCLVPQLISFVQNILETMPDLRESFMETMESLRDLGQRAHDAIANVQEDIMLLLSDPSKLWEMINGIDEQLMQMSEQVGEQGADLLVRIYRMPGEQMGFMLGRLIGMILWEVVFSLIAAAITFYAGGAGAGATAATSAGKVAIRVLAKIIKVAHRLLRPIIRFMSLMITKFKTFIQGITRVLVGNLQRLGQAMSRFLGRFKQLLDDIFERLRGRRRRGGDHGSDHDRDRRDRDRDSDDHDRDDSPEGQLWLRLRGAANTWAEGEKASYGQEGIAVAEAQRELRRIKDRPQYREVAGGVSTDTSIATDPAKFEITLRRRSSPMTWDDLLRKPAATRQRDVHEEINETFRNLSDDHRNSEYIDQQVLRIKQRFEYDNIRVQEDRNDEGEIDEWQVQTALPDHAYHTRITIRAADAYFGSRSNPVEFSGLNAWPKPAYTDYPEFYVGPKARVPIDQSDLENANGNPTRASELYNDLLTTPGADTDKLEEWNEDGLPVIRFTPDMNKRQLPYGSTSMYGLDNDSKLRVGKSFVMTSSSGTLGGGRFNDPLSDFGYRPSTEGMQGDHLIETQLGGNNDRGNLWQLDASTNSSGGSRISNMTFTDPDTDERVRMSELKSAASVAHPIHFTIRSIQLKLKIGSANDPLEYEADKVADQVVRQKTVPGIQRKCAACEREEQIRRCNCKQENAPPSISVMPKINHSGQTSGTDPPSEMEHQIEQTRGAGEPLSADSADNMGEAMGADFRGVRIHRNAASSAMNDSIGSRAFTVGRDIYFGSGEYNPGTPTGDHLIAHELTHTVQQGASETVRKETSEVEEYQQRQDEGIEVQEDQSVEQNQRAEEDQNPEQAEFNASELQFEQADDSVEFTPEGRSEDKVSVPKKEDEKTGANEKQSAEADQEKVDQQKKHGEVKDAPGEKKVGVSSQKSKKVESLALTGSSDQAMSSFTRASASRIAATYPSLGDALSEKMEGERAETESETPPVIADNTGQKEKTGKKAPETEKGRAEDIKEQVGPNQAPPKKEEHQNLGDAPDPTKNDQLLDKQKLSAFLGWFRQNFNGFLGGISTKDHGLNTDPGERPKVDTSGEGNPERTEKQREDGNRQATDKRDEVAKKIEENPGQENIQPQDVKEENEVLIEKKRQEVPTEKKDDMEHFLTMDLGEVRAQADQNMAPMLEKSLSGPGKDAESAASQKETDKQQAVDDAQAETDRLNGEANAEQQRTITEKRDEVAATQQEGKKEADQLMTDFNEEAGKEQNKVDKDVKDKITEKEGEAKTGLDNAEKEAEKKKEEGEKKAADKKRELEKESENDSWWDRAVNAVKSAVKAITNAISDIFDAVRKAVTEIINKAKELALAAIEAARKWVIEALDAFASFLKDIVNKYLAEHFPGLAKRINEAIDATVDAAKSAVNKIADRLKKGVKALADGLTAAINKVLDVFEGALKAAVAVAGAVLTGDFSEAARIVIESACQIAGIDPKPVFDFMEKAGKTIRIILDDPVQFIKNVAKGVGDGISLFVTNIKKHLISGLIGWLTGAMSDVPITLPEKWDLKGIFSLVMQILGLTYDQLRAKLVKKLGPDGEKVVSAMEKTVEFVTDLVTRGPIVLWEKIQDKFTEIKNMAMEKIRNLVTIEVVKAGVKWLIGLLNPASAIVKALMMLYDFVMFIIERKDQIIQFVKAVFDTVGPLARGETAKAAKSVEGAMAKSVPVILSLLASLAGIGGIGKSVQKAIKAIRKPVDKVVDPIINWIAGIGRKMIKGGKMLIKKGKAYVKGKVKKGKEKLKTLKAKVFGWWKMKKSFKAKDGSDHNVYFKGKEKSAQLMVHSKKENKVEKFLNGYSGPGDIKQAKTSYAALMKHIDKMNNVYQAGDPTRQQKLIADLKPKITNSRDALVKALGTMQIDGKIELGQSHLTFGAASGQTKYGIGAPITKIPGNTIGSPTGGAQILTEAVQERTKRNASRSYVQAHLISHQFHGPAKAENLVMAPGKVNKGELQQLENQGKKLMSKGEPFYYGVKAEMHNDDKKGGDRYFVKNLYKIPVTKVNSKNAEYNESQKRWVMKEDLSSKFSKLASNLEPPVMAQEADVVKVINDLKGDLKKTSAIDSKKERIKKAVNSLIDLQLSFAKIATWFNTENVPHPDGNEWTRNSSLIKNAR